MVIPASVKKISQENEKGLEIAPPPSSGARVDSKLQQPVTNVVCRELNVYY